MSKSGSRPAPFVLGCLALPAIWPLSARAEAAPDDWRSDGYYILHGSATASLLLATAGAKALLKSDEPGPDFTWFPGDLGVRQNRSEQAASLSNITLPLTIAAPLAVQLGQGAGPHLANASLIYSETLAANLFLNTVFKFSFRRPRPYTYANEGAGQSKTSEQIEAERADAYVSFYSGHSSTAFAAAVSGSYLFAESAPNETSRCMLWGVELALAGATANLRVRAGKHYYSDVVVGALVGGGLGAVIPLLHGAKYTPAPAEYLSAGGGLVLGVTVSQLLVLDDQARMGSTDLRWALVPAVDGSAGLQLVGQF